MIRLQGALVVAMLLTSACAPFEAMRADIFPPEKVAVHDVRSAPAVSATVEPPPPPPRRKPEDVGGLALSYISAPYPHDRAAWDLEWLRLDEANPERLVGLDFDATKALLGDPAAQLELPPAKVWAYAGGTCMFNLFFYPSVDDTVFRVLAYEVTDETRRAGDPTDAAGGPGTVKVWDKDSLIVRRCLAQLLQSKQEPSAG